MGGVWTFLNYTFIKMVFLNIYTTTGNTGFEFLVDSSSPMHYPSLALSKPWESYRLRVLSAASQSGSVTSLPYINTVSPVSGESMSLYSSSQPVSLPGAGGSVSELRTTSEIKASQWFFSANFIIEDHFFSFLHFLTHE